MVLLLLDNTPGHPKHLDSIDPNVTIHFLSSNASLIQPLDQAVISPFKAHYLRRTMSQMLDDTDDFDNPSSKPTIRELWKKFSIRNALSNTDASVKRKPSPQPSIQYGKMLKVTGVMTSKDLLNSVQLSDRWWKLST